MTALAAMLVFPCGLFVLVNGWAYAWANRKLLARMQRRVGPRWFQPAADVFKLLTKDEVMPELAQPALYHALPVVALAGTLAAALYVPFAGFAPVGGFNGDLIVVVYLLALLTLCAGVAGLNSGSRYGVIGAGRLLAQLFAYEAPFLMAALGPAFAAHSWHIGTIAESGRWLLIAQPLGFAVALLSLMGKIEIAPFNAPEAETEIIGGAFTEYSGRGLALFLLAKQAALVVGLTLVAALYLGGLASPLDYLLKTLLLLGILTLIQALFTRFRIDQTVNAFWRVVIVLALVQWLILLTGG